MDDLGTLLGIWAHPDDETYLTAGLMAQAVRDGRRVVCVTATRGEGGSMDEERWPSATMGQVREAELMRCFEILGVTEHHWLDELDVDMDTGLSEAGYEKVRDIMADVQPDTVLTFGPDGMTGPCRPHVRERVGDAGAGRGREARREGALRDEHAGVGGRIRADLQPVRRVPSGNPPVTPRDELSIDFLLPPELLELKLRAIEEHESQVGGMVEAFGEDIFRRAMKAEWFRLGAVKP